MKKYSVISTAVVFIFFACNNGRKAFVGYTGPKVVEAKGYVVPADSMAKPLVVPVDESKLKKIPVGKPNIIPIHSNVHPAVKPKVVVAGTPRICTPGQGGFPLPNTVAAIDRPFLAGIPEIVEAKDPSTKDSNPHGFRTFDKLQGLKDNNILSMLEDHAGNLWFGTLSGGVSKYDGKYFTHFTNEEGLVNNTVNSILQDQSGNLWIGTTGGVSKYDGKSFTQFTEKEGISNNGVNSILEDQYGQLWFGTAGGVSRYDGKSFTHFTEREGLSNNFITSILEDQSGNLWFGTNGGGICKYDGKSFAHFTEKEGLINNTVWSIMEDRSGNLWFGTVAGVSKYDGKSFTHFTEKEGISNNNITSMVEDQSGNLWFGTDGGGANKYDGKSFTHFTENEGLFRNDVFSILEDQSGNLWFGTWQGGVSKYDGKSFMHFTEKEGLARNKVVSILQDQSGNLWFSTNGGVSIYDGKSFANFTETEGLLSNKVGFVLEDQSGNLWFSGIDGVNKYDGKSFVHFTKREGLPINMVTHILEDKSGNLWFATWGGGVSKYDGKSFTHFTEKEGLANNTVYCIGEDRSGNLWFGTWGKGLSKYDGKSFTNFTEKEGLSNNFITGVVEDQSGNLWIGTDGGGVNKYDGKSFTHFTEKEGLSNNIIWSILEDRSGNLWFGTQFGLSKLSTPLNSGFSDPDHAQAKSVREHDSFFKNYSYDDGLLGVGYNALYQDRNGKIWMGGDDRLTVYDPSAKPDTDTIPPNIQIIALQLFNENIPWVNLEKKMDSTYILGNGVEVGDLEFDSTSRWYGLPEHLSLAYDNNYLTFSFVGITMNQSRKVKYQYTLEGMDKSWNALTSRTEAPYGNLPPGSYAFKVKAMNSDGYWSKEFKYPFIIRPPWWYSWWAYGFYLLFFCGVVLIAHRYQKAGVIRKEREKTQHKELEQAKEIKKAYDQLEESHTNLKATQTQLIQSEKMASLGELTAGIAHEIQNPLNFVNNFSEVNKELIDEMSEEIEKGNFEDAKIIAKDIKENQEKINNHGRKADAIVKGMLQHSRINSGVKEPTNINTLADEYLRLAYHGLRAKDKSFNAITKTEFDETVGILNVIPQDIGRVILNLIANAFYAVAEKKNQQPAFEPAVTVATKRIGDNILITVKDNGNGISQKVLDKIFQPFFTTKPTGQGTGLGLSLSYDIVKAHSGELTVETKDGEGSQFMVRLPA